MQPTLGDETNLPCVIPSENWDGRSDRYEEEGMALANRQSRGSSMHIFQQKTCKDNPQQSGTKMSALGNFSIPNNKRAQSSKKAISIRNQRWVS